MMPLTVHSSAFASDEPIPRMHTGDGEDLSPPLSWAGAPPETREFAVICEDPDAPTPEPWVHWLLYKLPPGTTSLPAGIPPAARLGAPISGLQGRNSWSTGRTVGYRGPAPPPGHGVHHYHFCVYALNAELPVGPLLTKPQLLAALEPLVLDAGRLIGTYSR